jgi:hypothetical protein
MYALGSVRTLIIDSVQENKLQFNVTDFLTNIVLADLNLNGKKEKLQNLYILFVGLY